MIDIITKRMKEQERKLIELEKEIKILKNKKMDESVLRVLRGDSHESG